MKKVFEKKDIPILISIIEKEFDCIYNVDETSINIYEDPEEILVEIDIINVDDRKEDLFNLDNNKHSISEKLKNLGFEVYSDIEFLRKDAFPNGTSYYSTKISFI